MREQFLKFHKAHPKVWVLFVQFTFDRIDRGFKHYSANGVFERIRWETAEAKTPEGEFKISNNHRPFYARVFMLKYPEHEGFFRVHEQTSRKQPAIGDPDA